MFSDFLWFVGAKQQHDRQRELGLAGFMGLILTPLIVGFIMVKWDSFFYPLFDKIGFAEIAEEAGLVHDLPIMTVINVLLVGFLLLVFIGLGIVSVFTIGMLLVAVGQTKHGSTFLLIGGFILFLPLIIPITLYWKIRHPRQRFTMREVYRKDKALRPLLTKYNEHKQSFKMFRLYEEQIKREQVGHIKNLLHYQGMDKLNRVVEPNLHDRNWLFGYHKDEDQWYILFQNPLPEDASASADLQHSRKLIDFFNYPYNSIREASEGYFTNAVPVNFTWRENRINFELPSHFNVRLQSTRFMDFYEIEGDEVIALFDTLAERIDVQKAVHHAHMAFYLIPLAFKYDYRFKIDEQFNEKAKLIPNADRFRHFYAEDVDKSLQSYVNQGIKWAINYLEKEKGV